MKNTPILILAALVLSACTIGTKPEIAAGQNSIWCNNRYLPDLDAKDPVTDDLHLAVAKKGYLYALIGAYVLQKEDSEGKEHHFDLPDRVSQIYNLSEHDKETGFEANTFVVHSTQGKTDEIVIAFTGSNDLEDWKTNFSMLNRKQYAQARSYVKKVAKTYTGVKFSVTGYSLGGGLASHVTKNEETSELVNVAWVFNPSPKTWSNSEPDPRIWHASTTNDILKIARWPIFRILPGVAYVGAESGQRAENFYLIESNPVYAHFRWALARNILHTADLAFFRESKQPTSEPLEILKKSKFSACPPNL